MSLHFDFKNILRLYFDYSIYGVVLYSFKICDCGFTIHDVPMESTRLTVAPISVSEHTTQRKFNCRMAA